MKQPKMYGFYCPVALMKEIQATAKAQSLNMCAFLRLAAQHEIRRHNKAVASEQ
jgi:post-segregation antitoxin (ccd killing protein)